MFGISQDAGLAGLFVASFLSATVLPGSSELALIGMIQAYPDTLWRAITVATVGNTLGGMTSYVLGRLLPDRAQLPSLLRLRRYGYGALLLSWLPVVGDALCVAAGWLRFNPWLSALLIAAGKFARYLLIAGGWTWIARWMA